MRLLHTKDLCWIETPESVQPYAILSHRWLANPGEEVSFQDLQRREEHTFHPDVRRKEGFMKLKGACDRALQDGLNYIWIDTCCIDKSSSAELSEAINSMYAWYKDSAVCYVYLHDVDHNIAQDDLISALNGADWFKRGWTLQELLAPDIVYFFARDWSRIGSKATWVSTLHIITRIRKEILLGIPCSPSIAERMSWAVGRKTQKMEDRAYSLMGIFGIHMPVIYGEGEKAFRRLQLEIMQSSDDQTIFAWHNSLDYPPPSRQRGSLASAPDLSLFPSSRLPLSPHNPT
ncbi:HET-domain-containing protein [Rhizopogon vinicolor AM-OR11-026]|uniref:HET-domain-containing protein n=1 Tax=Rhizopogon vinicolor AM-OR11-026 TaxID=1314800 RepID=A0A1B7MWH8_9AGAM|nr:HET-domain-containing protein [Rhizopogon vinicolor AM-OR11-026]